MAPRFTALAHNLQFRVEGHVLDDAVEFGTGGGQPQFEILFARLALPLEFTDGRTPVDDPTTRVLDGLVDGLLPHENEGQILVASNFVSELFGLAE